MKAIESYYEVAVNGCWEWKKSLDKDGYGKLTIRNGKSTKTHRAHVYFYTIFTGNIPTGLVLDHTCRNRKCVNPKHLEPVTNRTNSLRGISFVAINAIKTHCPRGHEYTENNIEKSKSVRRGCSECRRIRQRKPNGYVARKHQNPV